MSTIKLVKNITTAANGEKVPMLEFVRRYTDVAAAVSKAIPNTEPPARDVNGERKLTPPDMVSMINIHRSISRRNKDAQLTMQMLPDLKLAVEMVVALILSPKDMINDKPVILSDCSDLLPSSILAPMLQVATKYYRKNNELSEFLQRALKKCFAYEGAVPVLIIPENSLDNLINNYNANLTVESFRKIFDVERNIPYPVDLLGVPKYLSDTTNKNIPTGPGASVKRFGAGVAFDVEAYDNYRSLNASKATVSTAGISFTKLLAKDGKIEQWKFSDKPKEGGGDFNPDDLIVVTDNVEILTLPKIKQAAMESRVAQVHKKAGFHKFHRDMESMSQSYKERRKREMGNAGNKSGVPSDEEVEALIFKNRRMAYTPVASLRTNIQLGRNSIGEPLKRELDTACFIVASVPSDSTRQIGGYIMLDEDGNPLSTYNHEPNELVDLTTFANGSGNFVSSLMERSDNLMNGKECNSMSDYMLRKYLTRAFGEIVEKDLIDRIKMGQYDNGVQLADNQDFFWLMLTRCMKGQRTQLLWVPQEFLVYFAMDYDDMGFGKSLLSDISNLTSMRVMLMVAGIQASLRNSIGRTKVSIKLDEEDPDAEKSIEDIQDEILKSRMNPIPFGVNNVADITKYLQRSCYEFEITGSTAIPDMQIGFEQFNSNYPKPDEELTELLKNLTIQHFGLTKDMIDAADGVEFAIQAATNNRMTMKRIQSWQRILSPQVAEYIRKIAFNSQHQLESYREILTKNFELMQIDKLKRFFNIEDPKMLHDEEFKKLIIEQCISEFINHMYMDFPVPDATTLESQKQQFDDMAEFYKAAMDYVVNESYFDTSIQGEGLSDHVDMIKNILVSHFMRDWMAKNAILPELFELTTIGEDGKIGMNVMDGLEKHIKALGMSTQNFFARFHEFSIKQTGLMQNVGEGSTTGETDTGGGGGGGDDSGYDDGGGDDGGDFDFDEPEEPEENADDEDQTNDDTEEPAGGEDNTAGGEDQQ